MKPACACGTVGANGLAALPASRTPARTQTPRPTACPPTRPPLRARGARRRHAALHRLRLERLVRPSADRDRDRLPGGRHGRPAAAAGARVDRQPSDTAPRRSGRADRDRLPRVERRHRSRCSRSAARRTQGCWSGSGGDIAGSGRESPRWYQLEGGPAGTNVLDVGAAPGTDVYAPVKGSVVAVSDLVVGGQARRQPHRPSAVGVAVGDGFRDERPARPVDRRRDPRARSLVEARHRRRRRIRRGAGARRPRTGRRQQRLRQRLSVPGSLP